MPVTEAEMRSVIESTDADYVLVNVWATWCGPCRAEFPEFIRFARDHADEGVALHFLSIDAAKNLSKVHQFLDAQGADEPTYISAEGGRIVQALAAPERWSQGIPVTFIFNGDGELLSWWEASATYDFIDAQLNRVRVPSDTLVSQLYGDTTL